MSTKKDDAIQTHYDVLAKTHRLYEHVRPFRSFVDLCYNSVLKGEITFDALYAGLLLAKDKFVREQELLIRDASMVEKRLQKEKEEA